MNLICFPHYTCGGLLCDIMSGTYSSIGSNGGIQSINHNYGKIGDTDSIQTNYSVDKFMSNISNVPANSWIGTHIWPDRLPLEMFNQVILITTSTSRSKIYRWLRSYYCYYSQLPGWKIISGMDRIDKERETAKNYLLPFLPIHKKNVINLEFSEVVDTTVEFLHLVENKDLNRHLDRWRSVNSFLYSGDIWNSSLAKRFHEAELEVNLGSYYVYE